MDLLKWNELGRKGMAPYQETTVFQCLKGFLWKIFLPYTRLYDISTSQAEGS
jgi:hypothetical protein